MKKSKLLMGLLLVPLSVAFATTTQAKLSDEPQQDGTTRVNLYKLLAKNSSSGGIGVTSDGQQADLPADFDNRFEYLSGAKFRVFDVTTYYYQYRNLGQTVSEAHINLQNQFAKSTVTELEDDSNVDKIDPTNGDKTGNAETEQSGEGFSSGIHSSDSGHGLVELELKNKLQGEEGAAYVIVESTTPISADPSISFAKTENTILVLPLDKDDNGADQVISIYPKNTITSFSKRLSEIDHYFITGANENFVEAEDNPDTVHAVTNGDILFYQAKITVPSNMDNATSLTFYDKLPEGLVFSEMVSSGGLGTVTPQTDGEFNVDTKTYSGTGNDLKLVWPAGDDLKNKAGQTFIVEYKVKVLVKSVEQVDQELGDNAYLLIGANNPIVLEDDSSKVATGGFKLHKIDGDTLTGLGGAGFNLYYITTGPIKLSKIGDNVYYLDPDDGEETKIESASDGKFEIIGFADGDFTLDEVNIPSGYIKPTQSKTLIKPITINENDDTTFESSDSGSDLIDNNGSLEIPNFAKGTLPTTGGKGIVALVLIGAIGLGIVLLLLKRKLEKENVEEV